MRVLCLALLLALPCESAAPGSSGEATDSKVDAWYDAESFSEALRPGAADSAKKALGLADLANLTLYDLKLTLRDESLNFALEQVVWFTNREDKPLTELVFRIYANARKGPDERPLLTLVSAECEGVDCRSNWDARSVLWITPQKPIEPGARIKVRMVFDGWLEKIESERTGMLTQAMEGLMRMSGHGKQGDYGMLAVGNGIASLGDFYAVLAPRNAGAWKAEDKSSIGDLGAIGGLSHVRAHLDVPAQMHIATTGVVVQKKTPMPAQGLPTRLEATIVAPLIRNFGLLLSKHFEVQTRQVRDVEVRSWYVHKKQGVGPAVLEHAAQSFAVFEKRFGDYPYVDLDVVEAPLVGGAGGVEFSGLVTIASMFYQPIGADGMLGGLLQGQQDVGLGGAIVGPMVEFVTAHEVAHQWWHGIVGSDARTHPFVDEALAQFSAVQYLEDRHGKDKAAREQSRQIIANYHMMRMQGQPDQAADQPASAFSNEIAYAGIVYGKAPMFYPSVRRAIGRPAFDGALRSYVEKFRFVEAGPRDLIELLAVPGHEYSVNALARRWLKETKGDQDLGAGDMVALMGQWGGLGDLGSLESLIESKDLEELKKALRELESLVEDPKSKPHSR